MRLKVLKSLQRWDKMQNSNDIYLLHEKYSSFFKGYYLLGSSDVWIPYFKKDIEVTYLTEENLTVAEEFVGKCIQRGIHKKSDIGKVLALKDNFLEAIIEPLIEQSFFTMDDSNGSMYLSDEGKTLFAKKIKHLNKKEIFSVMFDGLNEINKVEYLEYENRGFNRIKGVKEGIIIDGRRFPTYEYTKDYQRLSKQFLSIIETRKKDMGEEFETSKVVNVKDFKYLPSKEMLYRKYFMLIYANEEKEIELLVIDSMTESVQSEFNTVLKKRLLEGYFNSHFDLETAFEEHEKVMNELSKVTNQTEEPANTLNGDLERIESTDGNIQVQEMKIPDTTRYIMNAEIRRLFLHYLETAQKSLYIISPWINYHIVDNTFKNNIEKLLKRGVEIRIIYGITDGNDANFSDRDKKSKKIADELEKLGEKYNGLLKIQNGNTHEKILICDDYYYINGSYNVLSYDAEDNVKGQKGFRYEGSTYMENPRMALSVIEQRFDF